MNRIIVVACLTTLLAIRCVSCLPMDSSQVLALERTDEPRLETIIQVPFIEMEQNPMSNPTTSSFVRLFRILHRLLKSRLQRHVPQHGGWRHLLLDICDMCADLFIPRPTAISFDRNRNEPYNYAIVTSAKWSHWKPRLEMLVNSFHFAEQQHADVNETWKPVCRSISNWLEEVRRSAVARIEFGLCERANNSTEENAGSALEENSESPLNLEGDVENIESQLALEEDNELLACLEQDSIPVYEALIETAQNLIEIHEKRLIGSDASLAALSRIVLLTGLRVMLQHAQVESSENEENWMIVLNEALVCWRSVLHDDEPVSLS